MYIYIYIHIYIYVCVYIYIYIYIYIYKSAAGSAPERGPRECRDARRSGGDLDGARGRPRAASCERLDAAAARAAAAARWGPVAFCTYLMIVYGSISHVLDYMLYDIDIDLGVGPGARRGAAATREPQPCRLWCSWSPSAWVPPPATPPGSALARRAPASPRAAGAPI